MGAVRDALKSFRVASVFVWTRMDAAMKARLLLVLLLVVAASALTALTPIAMKWIVDAISRDAQGMATLAFVLIGAYVIGQWMMRVATVLRDSIFSRTSWRISRVLSRQLFAHVMHLPLRFHLDKKAGAVNQVMTHGVQGFQMVLQQFVFTFLPVVIEIWAVALILVHFGQAPFIALFGGLLVCYGGLNSLGVLRIAQPARAATSAQVEVSAVMTDSLLNFDTIKYFSAESVATGRFDRAMSHVEAHWLRYFRVRCAYGLGGATLFAVFFAVILLFAAWRVDRGLMTLGDFVLVNMYVFQILRPIEMLSTAMQQLSQGFALLERMLGLLGERPEPLHIDSKLLPGKHCALDFSAVCLSYGPDRPVLNDVSFAVPCGKTVAVVGASGAGKSTLVRLLIRLLEPDRGSILLDGTPIAALPLAQLRQMVAVVPQEAALFNDTIAYNISVGRQGCSQADIERAAALAHLHDFIDRLPQRYETPVGERGLKLSGGERQRIAIARAVLKQPEIFVFDEATASLDSHTEREILANLQEIAHRRTTLVIAHRLSTIAHADQIVVLDKGHIRERGSHAELLGMRGRYASLWNSQQLRAQ